VIYQRIIIIGVIAGLGLFTLAFEAVASSSSGEITIRFRDGTSVRVGGKLAALIAEGYSALQRKHYDQAISSFTAALQADPDKKVACATYFCRATAYSDKGELDKALGDWTAAIQLNPKYAGAYVDRAIVYSKKTQL
jgi:Tfp pilus assembly protein PilF